MRLSVGILLFFVLVQPVHFANAIFFNNSEVIEIGDGEPPEPPVESGGIGNSGGGSVGGGGSGGSSGGGGGGGSSQGTTTPNTGAGSGGDGTTVSTEAKIQELLALLTEAGAFLGRIRGGSGSNGLGQSGAGNSGAAGSEGFAGSRIQIIGAKVREAFQNNFELKDLLQYWKRDAGKEPTAEEYGLIAASTAIRDSRVQEISFTADTFEIVYRSRGYLLIVFPWSFPVRVQVIPSAVSANDQIHVTLPWYRFFVRKFFTIGGLTKDLHEVIEKTKVDNQGASDGTALIFEATAAFLSRKVGTVSDSVILGTPPPVENR